MVICGVQYGLLYLRHQRPVKNCLNVHENQAGNARGVTVARLSFLVPGFVMVPDSVFKTLDCNEMSTKNEY
jgi:hypothetical protein